VPLLLSLLFSLSLLCVCLFVCVNSVTLVAELIDDTPGLVAGYKNATLKVEGTVLPHELVDGCLHYNHRHSGRKCEFHVPQGSARTVGRGQKAAFTDWSEFRPLTLV
jgi:hypothetical protein